MFRILVSGAVMAALASSAMAQSTSPSAEEIVVGADLTRNPGQPFRVTDTLVEYINGQPHDRLTLVVFAKEDGGTHRFANLVRMVEPERDTGKMVLMNGSNMWFYDPSSKDSVRISPQQRLLGQAADGDVVTANLARDYAATLLGEEKLEDADRQNRTCWHLDLTASSDEAVYSRIEYWVEKNSDRPVKGKFYADSGRLLKIAYYRKYVEQLGRQRPSQTIVIDAVDQTLVTTMTNSDMRTEDIPDSWFHRDYLPRLKVE